MQKILWIISLSFSLWGSSPFVSAQDVNDHLRDSKQVLLDVGALDAYLQDGHIPGARQTDISEWREQRGTYQLLRSSSEIEKLAQKLGINHDSHVIIYGHNEQKELLKASYIAMALIINGHKNVSLLNGGFLSWTVTKSNREVSFEKPSISLGNFKSTYNSSVIIDRAYVASNIKKIPMIEARSPQHYFGIKETTGLKRQGHISGAMSFYWKNSFDDEDNIKDKKELQKMLVDNLEFKPNKEIISYCTGGLEASMNWYILTQVLDFENVKVYDASLREWANRDDTQMTRYQWEMFNH